MSKNSKNKEQKKDKQKKVRSIDFLSSVAIGVIKGMTDEKSIRKYIKNDTRATVNAIAEKQITSLAVTNKNVPEEKEEKVAAKPKETEKKTSGPR